MKEWTFICHKVNKDIFVFQIYISITLYLVLLIKSFVRN
jgi:hypothetical protein